MNQILYTGKGKKNNNSMNKTIIIFAIIIIIFAICLISIGVYIFSKTKINENVEEMPVDEIEEPVVEESIFEIYFSALSGKVKVNIESENKIESANYRWDEEEEIDIELGDDEYSIETQIEATKQGTHMLYITVTDIEGNTETKEQKVIGASEPEVKISTDGVSNYVITVKDDEEITKMIIDLNGVKTEVEVNEAEYEYKIAIPEGDSVIEVTAYNINNLTATKKAKITGFVK